MAAEKSGQDSSFDLDRFRELVELMEKHDLSDVSLRAGEQHWRVKRGNQVVVPAAGYPAPAAPVAAPATPPPAPAPESAPAAAPADDANVVEIKSPTVGTFYEAASPDDPPFAKAGTKVQNDTIVCLVEAMKVFNQIPAEVSGTVTEVLVKNGDAVDFGQPLFKVKV